MKVLFDHQAFQMQHVGGVSRYFTALLEGIPSASLSLKYTDNIHVKALDRFKGTLQSRDAEFADFAFGLDFRGKRRLYRSWNRLRGRVVDANLDASIKALKSGDYEVFHPTYYDPYFLPYLGGKPFVLTIHDMIHELFPEFFSLSEPTGRNKRLLAERADRIIAVSERTKQDIVEIFGIPDSRIDVIYHGSDLKTAFDRPAPRVVEGRYILYTGTRTAYKNFHFMVAALAPLFRENPDLSLVCTGPDFSSEEVTYFQEIGVLQAVKHRFVRDSELAGLYGNAMCFVFPSYYEGFGIPILEAFGCGCPVVLSDASCFREVADDAALYFEPKSGGSLRQSVRSLLDDAKLAAEMVGKGRERARKFCWSSTVEGTMRVYDKAVGDGAGNKTGDRAARP
ncbi:MAG: glycosyltransferase family 4 protein [Spirochaetales bacterium]|nr:glycosyltransferase family 4 protein [Spirochaetales bacterium]